MAKYEEAINQLKSENQKLIQNINDSSHKSDHVTSSNQNKHYQRVIDELNDEIRVLKHQERNSNQPNSSSQSH